LKADSTKTSPSDSTNLERSFKLAGKVAVVTGASSGIGEATVRELTRLGASVVMTARRFDRIKAIATEIEVSGGRAYALATDATQAYDLKRMVEVAEEQYGVWHLFRPTQSPRRHFPEARKGNSPESDNGSTAA
jgi:NADPH:quinone reductase-like Zn-dependent oxidoreductase